MVMVVGIKTGGDEGDGDCPDVKQEKCILAGWYIILQFHLSTSITLCTIPSVTEQLAVNIQVSNTCKQSEATTWLLQRIRDTQTQRASPMFILVCIHSHAVAHCHNYGKKN